MPHTNELRKIGFTGPDKKVRAKRRAARKRAASGAPAALDGPLSGRRVASVALVGRDNRARSAARPAASHSPGGVALLTI